MSVYRLGLYEKSMPNSLLLAQKLEYVKQAGFDFMEISVDESAEKLSRLEWSHGERADVLRASRASGVKIETMCLSGHRKYPIGSENSEIRGRGMEIMRAAVLLAADIGVRIIQIAGYDEYYNEANVNTRRIFVENLRKSVEFAAANGVMLAFETMETEFMNTVEKAMRCVSAVDSPFLQVYPDLGNITNAAVSYGHTVESDLMTGKGHIAAMHLKESKPGIFREIPFGEGHVDFEAGIREAFSLGVRMFVGEFWYTGNDDWRGQLDSANAFLRNAFKKAAMGGNE